MFEQGAHPARCPRRNRLVTGCARSRDPRVTCLRNVNGAGDYPPLTLQRLRIQVDASSSRVRSKRRPSTPAEGSGQITPRNRLSDVVSFLDRDQEIQTLHQPVWYPGLWRFRNSFALAIERVRGRRRVGGRYTLVHCVRPHPRSRRLRSPREACLVQSRNNTGYVG